MVGFISIHRQIQDHWVWGDSNDLKMWLTILLHVNHKNGKIKLGNAVHTIERGQCSYSLRTWSNVLGCGTKKVSNFFKLLESDSMIKLDVLGLGKQSTTLITIVNYEDYQGLEKRKGNTKATQGQREGNAKGIQSNNVNNVNNVNKQYTEELFERYKKFIVEYNSIHKTKYKPNKNHINNFKYWIETYTPSEILQAVKNHDSTFWADDINPQWLFRTKDTKGQPVDYIGQLLNHKPKNKMI